MIHQINDKDYWTGSVNGQDTIIEYFTVNNKRHRENGPALISDIKSANNKYLEWWENGILLARFDQNKGIMEKTDNSMNDFYEVQIPDKWRGKEQTLSLHDIKFCNKPSIDYSSELPPTLAAADVLNGFQEIETNNPFNLDKDSTIQRISSVIGGFQKPPKLSDELPGTEIFMPIEMDKSIAMKKMSSVMGDLKQKPEKKLKNMKNY